MDEQQKRELLEINKKQTEFYQKDKTTVANLPTILWRNVRLRLINVRKSLGIDKTIDRLHLEWMGDLSQKRVLDLGCYAGNPLSMTIARNSREYLAVDLSPSALSKLDKRLKRNNLDHATVRAVDFLSSDFANEKFDFIYARAVAHHFKYFEVFLESLRSHLNPGGRVITYDPLQTYWVLKVLRGIYRPFQSDKDWEFPFTRESIKSIEKRFRIVRVQGVLGRAKWCLPMAFLSPRLVDRYGPSMFEKDLKNTNRIGSPLWRCLQITMLLE